MKWFRLELKKVDRTMTKEKWRETSHFLRSMERMIDTSGFRNAVGDATRNMMIYGSSEIRMD